MSRKNIVLSTRHKLKRILVILSEGDSKKITKLILEDKARGSISQVITLRGVIVTIAGGNILNGL
jgi:hypothetical protein